MTDFLVNPYSEEFLQNPYPHYRKMRESTPVLGLRGFKGTDWLLSSHDHICAVLKSKLCDIDNLPERLEQLSKARQEDKLAKLASGLGGWLFFLPAEVHNRIRRVLSPFFSKSKSEALEADVHLLADQLFSALESGDDVDVISDIATPLPFQLACRVLGIRESDLVAFQHHAIRLFEVFRQPMGVKSYTRIAQSYTALVEAFDDLMACERAVHRDSLFHFLRDCIANNEELTRSDVMSFLTMLLAVGQDTTQNLIGNCFLALAQHDDSCEEAAEHIDDLDRVVDELARYDTPVQLVMRRALVDQEIGGQSVERGDRLYLFLGAALHDPKVFPDPEAINYQRDRVGTLPFGAGVHFCLGSHLARMATRTVLERVLSVPNQSLSVAGGPVQRIKQTHIRGVRELRLNMKRSGDLA